MRLSVCLFVCLSCLLAALLAGSCRTIHRTLMKILPVTGKKRLNFGSDLDASAMSQPPNTAGAWLPGYYRGLRERWMRKSRCNFFVPYAQKVGYGTPLTPKSGGYAYPRTLRK